MNIRTKNLIDSFTKIRDIPYSVPLSSNEEDFCCTGKHKKFLEYLKKENYEVRWRVCTFTWSSLNLPNTVVAFPHDDNSSHAYLEVLIGGEWKKIDLTWDIQLAKVLLVNQWDGISDTVVAVPSVTTYSPEESLSIIENEDKAEVEADLVVNCKFYEAFNQWLQEMRSQ